MHRRAMENTCAELEQLKPVFFYPTHPNKGRVPGTGPGRAAQLWTVCDDSETQVMKTGETVDTTLLTTPSRTVPL